jgi:hypothetical protein
MLKTGPAISDFQNFSRRAKKIVQRMFFQQIRAPKPLRTDPFRAPGPARHKNYQTNPGRFPGPSRHPNPLDRSLIPYVIVVSVR